jgi:hypothetical protein
MGRIEQKKSFAIPNNIVLINFWGYVFIDKEHHLNKGKEANLSNHFTVTEPMTLFPSPFPKELFEEVWDLQELMARVSLRVSLNYDFLSVIN